MAVVALTAGGCQTLGFYSQSVFGQLELLSMRQPIDTVIDNPQTPPGVRDSLSLVREARVFAIEQLQLPDNGSFTEYAELGRPHVVWNVFATDEFSIAPETWCFPVAGCVSYRGYFSERDATSFSASLAQRGKDTYVGGVSAYSTLGWFRDPVLSTVLDYPEERLVGLVFHELAHQRVYVKGDTVFNESFATSVELAGLEAWLTAKGRGDVMALERSRRRRNEEFVALLLDTRRRLGRIYAEPVTNKAKRLNKNNEFIALRRRYEALKASWQGYNGYDGWFDRSLNNAHLVAVAAYHQHLPAFERLLEEAGGSFSAFYSRVEELTRLPKSRRDQALTELGSATSVSDATDSS